MGELTQRNQVAAMLPYSMLRYVEQAVGRSDAEAIRRAAGEPKTLEQMAERGAWCTTASTMAIAEAAARLTGDPNIGRSGGDELFRLHEQLGLADILIAEGSVVAALERVIGFSSRVSTGRLMRIVERFEQAVLVEGTYQPDVPTPELFCNFAMGYWSNVPSLFGARGFAAELECQARGDERCLTRVSWTAPSANDHEAGAAGERRDQMFVRYEDLQQMAAELVAAEDVDAVLDLVVQRAGTAVLAPKFLLVVRIDEHDQLRVHHRGFRDDESARRVATTVLEGRVTDSTLVVDVTSARTSFGKIAAFYPRGAPVLANDARLMTAYAGHAAAALEAASALERAQRDRDTAQALLDLSRALATVGTPDEVSGRLATALGSVAGSDLALVWLWNADERHLRLAAATSQDVIRLLPAIIDAGDIPGIAELAADPRPVVLDAQSAKGILRDMMAATGSTNTAVVPVVSRDTFFGLVTAGFRDGITEAERAPLLARLAAVADHAATAIDNAHLVEHIRHQALHDALTGLPNRPLIEDRANQALRAAARSGRTVGLLFLDLDRFKNVNDTLGHRAGDALICQVVRRLQDVTRCSDTLARLGGDEFVVLVTDIEDQAAVTEIAMRLIEALHAPFVVDGHQLFISVSIGVAVAPDHGSKYEILMQHADGAMYEAKALGRNTVAVHAADVDESRQRRLELESALHSAIANDELAVVYQPQIDLRTTRIVGVEALVRWHHPTRGTIGPDVFIPIAEESGLIVEIDRWVRRTAFDQLRAWQDGGFSDLRLALNLSGREIRNPGVARDLAADMAEWNIDPATVEIEVTDRVVMAETDLPAVLEALRATGVRLAIDDFGTGSSVIGRLQRCPIDTLKIDKSFVQEMTAGSEGAIVPALVQMAQTLGLEVVAEGVETAPQAGILRKLGCHTAQGFFFSRPVPADEIDQLLHDAITLGGDAPDLASTGATAR